MKNNSPLRKDVFEYLGGQKVKHLMSPEGTFFAGRKAALEHMETTDGYSPEDIELIQSGLKVIICTITYKYA